MKNGLYLVFRCLMCGTAYEKKFDRPEDFAGNSVAPELYAEHIADMESRFVATHHCTAEDGINPDTYGCSKLIGCRIYGRAERESADDSGGGGVTDGPVETPAAPPSVAEVAKAATDAGMSYGRYVQMMQQKKAQVQPRPPVTTCCAPAPKQPEISEEEWNQIGQDEPEGAAPEPMTAPAPKRRCSKYSPETRADAVRLAMESEESLKDTAERIGVPYPTLYKWVSDFRKSQK